MRKLYYVMLLVLLGLSACAHTPTGNSTQKDITVGVVAILSGDYADYGLASKAGLDEAAEFINSHGGINGHPLRLIYEDSQGDKVKAVSAYNRLLMRGVDAMIIADGSGSSSAVAPLADQTNTLTIGVLGSAPGIAEKSKLYYRTVPSDALQGKLLADVVHKMGFKSAAVLYVNDAYGDGLAKKFKESFQGTVQEYPFQGDDVRTQLLKIKGSADVLILVSRTETPGILKQVKELGLSIPIIGSETVHDEKIIEASGSASEGIYTVFFSETTDYQGFKSRYLAKHGEKPPAYSEYAYDAVMVYSDAVKKASSTDPFKVASALDSLTYKGASGIITFDENGDVSEKPMDLFRVVNGQFKKVEI